MTCAQILTQLHVQTSRCQDDATARILWVKLHALIFSLSNKFCITYHRRKLHILKMGCRISCNKETSGLSRKRREKETMMQKRESKFSKLVTIFRFRVDSACSFQYHIFLSLAAPEAKKTYTFSFCLKAKHIFVAVILITNYRTPRVSLVPAPDSTCVLTP